MTSGLWIFMLKNFKDLEHRTITDRYYFMHVLCIFIVYYLFVQKMRARTHTHTHTHTHIYIA